MVGFFHCAVRWTQTLLWIVRKKRKQALESQWFISTEYCWYWITSFNSLCYYFQFCFWCYFGPTSFQTIETELSILMILPFVVAVVAFFVFAQNYKTHCHVKIQCGFRLGGYSLYGERFHYANWLHCDRE